MLVFQYFSYRHVRTYNFPRDTDSLNALGKKKFSDETTKKVKWVCKMYSEWKASRNATGIDIIECDLEDIASISVGTFNFAMKRFLSEVRKLDGTDFPADSVPNRDMCAISP